MSEARSYRDYAGYYGKPRDYRDAQAAGLGAAVPDMLGAFSDWDRSGGGYGGGCCCGGGGGYGATSGLFNDGTLFALLAGAALAFYILYTTITMNVSTGTGRGSRKKRNSKTGEAAEEDSPFVGFEDIIWLGRLSVVWLSALTAKSRHVTSRPYILEMLQTFPRKNNNGSVTGCDPDTA